MFVGIPWWYTVVIIAFILSVILLIFRSRS